MSLSSVLITTIAAIGLLAGLRSAARGTTMLYAWGWACVAAAGIATVEIAIALPKGQGLEPDTWKPARYLAAILLFCPLMSALGSKRPHEQAWQWIVLSLWGILALPALEWLALRRAPALEISGVRGWFLLLLVGMTALHWLGTRVTVAGVLLAAAQTCALWEWLPIGGEGVEPWISHLLLLSALAAGTLSLRSSPAIRSVRKEDHSATDSSEAARDQVWRDFRDRFGTLWAFRLMERVNSAASLAGWNARLEWNGVRPLASSPPSAAKEPAAPERLEQENGLNQALWNLLRRFVATDWCQSRGWTPPD